MRRRYFLIYNPAAGKSRHTVVAQVEHALAAGGGEVVRCRATTSEAVGAEAAAAAQSGNFDALVAAGGDGTIRQAAVAVRDTGCPLGAIMIGTGNVLAHELGLPREPSAIAAMLQDGPAIPVELGLANGKPFLLMAGAGLDGRIIERLHLPLKRWIGKAAFGPAALSALSSPLDTITATIDGRAHRCTWAIVSNASHYGSTFRLTSRTSLTSPGLAAVLFRARNRRDVAAHLAQLAMSRLDVRADLDPDWVSIHPCTHAHITADPSVPVQVDGDCFGATPLEVFQGGGYVSIIVPANTKRA
jgi:diacylglycerol kinase (ATP)